MVDAQTLLVFAGASAALVAAPGPAVGIIVTTTLRRGRSAGLASTAGIAVGDLVHVTAAVVGVSALLAASATAFTAVKVGGAVWLLWLAVRSLRARTPGTISDLRGPGGAGGVPPAGGASEGAGPSARTFLGPFRTAALVGTLNPKTALFFLAFLPQFVQPGAGPAWAQMLVLGLVFVGIAGLGNTLWALGGAGLHRLLPHVRMVVVDRLSAAVLALLGALTLTARRVVT